MKKKFCFVFLILACFVLAGFGGIFPNVAFAEEATSTAAGTGELVIEGNNALDTFKNLFAGDTFNNYAKITLNCDITLTEPLTSTLGTETTPFSGVFNGRGHTISGLNVDGSSDLAYAGLFGVTDGATIKNLKLSGSISLKTKPGYSAYMGALVGLAKNTTIENVDVEANALNFNNTSFDKNLSFGILAGGMVSSSANKVICRTGSLGNYQINNNRYKEIVFGGVTGKLISSQIHSSIVQTTVNVNVGEDFNGDFKFGGVAGQTSDGTTEIINVAENNTINFVNNALLDCVKAGEVVGEISSPCPNQGNINNISYIHYKDNANLYVFGDQGQYDYMDTVQKNCNITTNQNNVFNTKEYYINTSLWNADYIGIWDFDHDWHVAAGRIENQAFLENLKVQLSENLNSEVLTYKTLKINDAVQTGNAGNAPELANVEFRYGDKIEIGFAFNEESWNTGTGAINQRIIQFYDLRELQLTSNFDVSSTYRGTIEMTMSNEAINNISLSSEGGEGYSITPTTNVEGRIDGFTLTIDSLSIYSSGNYNITMDPRTFTATLTSKLFETKEGASETEVPDVEPGYIYNANGTPTTRTSWQADISYKADYTPTAHTESVRPYYVFEAWYVDDGSGITAKISSSPNLELKLGAEYVVNESQSYYITGNVNIYAKYIKQSRQIFFSIDNSSSNSGIEKVVVIDGKTSQTLQYSEYLAGGTEAQSLYINQKSDSIEMEIYVKQGYSFDTKFFSERNTVQGGYQCEYADNNQSVVDDFKVYRFDFSDLTKKDNVGENHYEALAILISTKIEDNSNNMMLWIIIGSVSGVVLIGLIILIIVLVKRRGGGGGKNFRTGKKVSAKNTYKSSKKDFKQMYF